VTTLSHSDHIPVDFRVLRFPDPSAVFIGRTPTAITYAEVGDNGYFVLGARLDQPDGVVTSFKASHDNFKTGPNPPDVYTRYDFTGFSVSAPTFLAAYETRDPLTVTRQVLAGDDSLPGSHLDDSIGGLEGRDTIEGLAGNDTLGGDAGQDYLRGGDGADFVIGGLEFDDLNGNAGNDTVEGGLGDDWVVGGKDNDLLSGGDGGDIVWGNLGADTQDGGDGVDQVRGGQGDDSVAGGAGDDFVSGDRGSDTVTGGAGADLFHSSQDAGLDRVLDFNLAEGDRVMLDPGTTFTVTQVGADTVIDMGGGNQMVLVGVQMATLTPGWIFGA
jgi:Ca2+-binding RTX toxin-like protein